MQTQTLFLSFILIALAELGDKTQLTVLTLSCKYSTGKVFSGAASAYFILTILAVAAGAVLFELVPSTYIKIISAFLFIFFGIITFIKASSEEAEEIKNKKGGFLTSFSMILLTEIGDKTQILTVVLAAKYKAPFEVFTGALLGLWLITLIGVSAGRVVNNFVKDTKLIHKIAGVVFIVLGVVSLVV